MLGQAHGREDPLQENTKRLGRQGNPRMGTLLREPSSQCDLITERVFKSGMKLVLGKKLNI